MVLASLFTDSDGNKEIDPTIDNRLRDVVWVEGEAIEIGHTYTVFTQYKNTKTGEVVSEDTSTYTAKNKEDKFEVFLDLAANTLNDGDQLTATHVVYYEETLENEVAREDDLTNNEQTVSFKTPEQPEEKTEEKTKEIQEELPETGSKQSMVGLLLGITLSSFVGLTWATRSKIKKNKN
ncbi:LPXTG cell wall anchor domain-containing protein [Enterococcus mundtii]|nr:LPXTG cell wall anchor domain-containing protein [Enterococcus mundtii]